LIFETEMTANKRVSLSPTRVDRFGIPVGRVDLGLSELDKRTLAKVEALASEIGGKPDFHSFFSNGRGINGNHPLGGLRMSENAETGVVNDRCRAHDFDNLYIFGGGAFCSTGTFNPTLTITALTLRALEDSHLGWTHDTFSH
jgi:choline dehydrogenase-like flavoprotein